MKRKQIYHSYTLTAGAELGRLIQLHRKSKKMTAEEVAMRVGISRATLHKIERGEMTCEIGSVFEVAHLVGVPLFAEDENLLNQQQALIGAQLALLPKRIRSSPQRVDDEF